MEFLTREELIRTRTLGTLASSDSPEDRAEAERILPKVEAMIEHKQTLARLPETGARTDER